MASIDYKALYEAKCVENETLKAEVEDLETQVMEYETTERSDIEDLEEMTQEKAELEEKVEELEENVENLTATLEMTMDNIKKCKTSCDGGVYGLVPQEDIEKLKVESDVMMNVLKENEFKKCKCGMWIGEEFDMCERCEE